MLLFSVYKTVQSPKKFGKKIKKQIKKLFVFFFDETGFQYVKYWRVSKNTEFPCYLFTSSLLPFAEAATGGGLWKKVLLEISQHSQESPCARVFF